MGGLGSGRYCHWSKSTTMEETKRIDIRYMRRRGFLRSGHFGSLSWTYNGEPSGDIRFTCHADRIVFNYRYRSGGDEWESVEQSVCFDRTPCHLGGERIWLLCPHCQRRCEVLSIAGKYPACRICYRLPYQSQCEDHLSRLFTRQQKLEEMLWGENRKWWRRTKRDQLLAEYEHLMDASEVGLYLKFGDYLA